MIFRSKIKWAALGVLILSFLSLLFHLFVANSSDELGHYIAVISFNEDKNIGVGGKQVTLLLLLYVFLSFYTNKRHAFNLVVQQAYVHTYLYIYTPHRLI